MRRVLHLRVRQSPVVFGYEETSPGLSFDAPPRRLFLSLAVAKYDREGDDKVLEQIVLYYEAGLL